MDDFLYFFFLRSAKNQPTNQKKPTTKQKQIPELWLLDRGHIMLENQGRCTDLSGFAGKHSGKFCWHKFDVYVSL